MGITKIQSWTVDEIDVKSRPEIRGRAYRGKEVVSNTAVDQEAVDGEIFRIFSKGEVWASAIWEFDPFG